MITLLIYTQRMLENEEARKAFVPHLHVRGTHFFAVSDFYTYRYRYQGYFDRCLTIFRDNSLLAYNHNNEYDL